MTSSEASSEDFGHGSKEFKQPIDKTFSVNAGEGGVSTDIGLLSEVEHFSNGNLAAEDVEIIAAHLDDRNIEESKAIVEKAITYHYGDPCLSQTYYDHIRAVVQGPYQGQSYEEWEALLKFDAFLIHDWSIYPEVRAVTRPIDEDDYENYENIRVYINSIIWSCAGSVLATFFEVRFPSISLANVAVQLLIAYTGRLLAYIPGWSIPVGFGRRFHFGGGKWNYKEQMLATCGMGVGNATPYSQDVILAMANQHFYNFKDASSFGFIILLTLSTNMMGFGLAGIFRSFLVYPVRCVWYYILPSLKLSRVLIETEHRENVNGWRLHGSEFFWLFSIIQFGWYWITDFVFNFLSQLDWVAWISHNNNNLLSVCGLGNGLGINPFPSLDFSIFLPTPMVTPYFATVSTLGGMVVGACAICAMFWTNSSHTGYLPINTNDLYDNTGSVWSVNRVLNEKHELDEEKYQNYSLPFWSAGNIVVYGAFFMFYPAMIVYSILNYGDILLYSFKIFFKTILNPRVALDGFDDRFTRAQRKYKEVPEWWYLLFLCICIGMGIACVEHYKFTNTPVWTIFFGIGLSAVFMVPCGILYATTNTQVVINVLYELVIGLAIKGNGTALMVAKAYATNFMAETDTYITNLKMGHYTGIAPRPMFRIQVINMIVNSFVQSGLISWQASPNSIPNLCSPDNKVKFSCQNTRTYFNAAVQWGTIGPARVFKGLYPGLRWTFLVGACYPLPFWVVRKFVIPYAREHNWKAPKEGGSKFRNSGFVRTFLGMEWINAMNEMIIIQGALNFAPYNFWYYLPWLYVGFLFQVWIPRYYPRWWQKYNYLLYAAITVGYSYSALIVFFATSYHHIASVNWWGNDTGVSLTAGPRLNATDAPDGYFGPRLHHFP